MNQRSGTKMTEWNQRTWGWNRGILAGLVLLLTAASAAGCSPSAVENGAKTVKVTKAAMIKLDDKTELEADLIASSQVNVVVKTGGEVTEVLKKRGDTVEPGDVLFKLDSVDVLRNKEKNQL